jgi:AraC family transcriptional regulator of adaptative response/methylated-DNA-[protein]-cysteine methyltransferase
VTTYGAIATALGDANAARAVGSAVGSNPVSYLIPCHRVIRASGELGGYAWGPDRKRVMLALEGGSVDGDAGKSHGGRRWRVSGVR